MSNLLNKSATKQYALRVSKELRAGKFKRVSKRFLDDLEDTLRRTISSRVQAHPSIGVTLK